MTDLNKPLQQTIQKEVSRFGIGLFTGKKVRLCLVPKEAGYGIQFRRLDLSDSPLIPADVEYIKNTPRCTQLLCSKASVQTVEHLLSALSAYQIDNLEIQLDAPEIPVGDGSASLFVEMLEEAKVCSLNQPKEIFILKEPVYWSEGEVCLIALPFEGFKISYTLHDPRSSLLDSQYFSFKMDIEKYKKEIAPCRTFSLYEEIEPLLKQGFLKGASLQNAVMIKDHKIANLEGLRFKNEMARHKILDLIGDLSLIGMPICAHIISVRSGHYSNVVFSKKLKKHIHGETS